MLLQYYIVIIALSIYSFYKNGYILYKKHLVSYFFMFKPILMVLLALVITYFIDIVILKFIKKKKYSFLSDFKPIYMVFFVFCLPLNISFGVLISLILIFSVFECFLEQKLFNYIVLFKLISILILMALKEYSYLTIYDTSIETNFMMLDLFLGKCVTGIGTSNILLILGCYLFLCLSLSYKKEIPIISFVTYFICILVSSFLFNNSFILEIKNLVCGEFIFGIVFIATISNYSPLRRFERVLYAILIGLLSYLFNGLVTSYESIFISIFIVNLLGFLYSKFVKKILARLLFKRKV